MAEPLVAAGFRIDAVAGPDFGAHSDDKSGEILRALPENADPARCCMVGDRKFDVLSGRKCGLYTVAAAWGYADEGELEACRPDAVAQTPYALIDLLELNESPD